MSSQLEEFYRDNYKAKIALISRIAGGNKAFGEDVVQEAFTRALKYIHLYDPDRGDFSKWFNGILFNTFRDLQNEERGYQELHRSIVAGDILHGSSYNVYINTKKFNISDAVDMVLNEKHRRILRLFFILGYSTREISQIVERTTQTNVTTIVLRFKQMLSEEE